jgi:hypothetical protein
MKKWTLVLAGTVALFAAASAEAAPIFSFSGGIDQAGQVQTFAFDFTPVQDITVEALGFFDSGQDGLASPHRVGLWTLGGTLLTSATVTTANSSLSGDVVNGGQFRYTPIAGVNVLSGVTYRLGAAIEGAADVWFAAGVNISASPSLATVAPTGFFSLSAFAFPNQTIGNRYAAGNLLASPTAVPEPSSFFLFGTGAAGLIAAVRRRRKR